MTISYARPEPPHPISAEEALEEAVYWLHFGNSPENALPWLTYAGRHGREKQDFDEIAKYDAQVERRAPEKWRAYQRGKLKIEMKYHPRSLASRQSAKHERGDNPRTARSKPKAHGRKPKAGGSGIAVGVGLKKKIDGALGRRK